MRRKDWPPITFLPFAAGHGASASGMTVLTFDESQEPSEDSTVYLVSFFPTPDGEVGLLDACKITNIRKEGSP